MANKILSRGGVANLILELTKKPGEDCIYYPVKHSGQGYTKVKYLGKSCLAHRLSLQLNSGPAPFEGYYACHRCNNPPCINPLHLYWGTPANNTADSVKSGTTQRGEKNVTSKLTAELVLKIRADNRSCRKVAIEYGISGAHVSLIRSRKTWAWL